MLKKDVSRRLFRALWGLASLSLLFGGAEARADEVRAEPAAATTPAKKETRKTALDLSGVIGGAIRLGDAPLFDVSRRGGLNVGLGFAYVMQPISLGLSYEHTGLGVEDSGVTSFGAVRIARAVDTVWASMRVRLSVSEHVVPYMGVGLGATWQYAHLDGVFLLNGGLYGGRSFSCSATDTMNLALRANVGAELPLSKTFSFVVEGSFDAYRLSSEVFENCAPGAGTTSAIVLRTGFTYRFDLTDGETKPLPSAAQVR